MRAVGGVLAECVGRDRRMRMRGGVAGLTVLMVFHSLIGLVSQAVKVRASSGVAAGDGDLGRRAGMVGTRRGGGARKIRGGA